MVAWLTDALTHLILSAVKRLRLRAAAEVYCWELSKPFVQMGSGE